MLAARPSSLLANWRMATKAALFASLHNLLRERGALVRQVPGRLAPLLRDHAGIRAAVEGHDARLAHQRMTKDLDGAQRLIQKIAPSTPAHGGTA